MEDHGEIRCYYCDESFAGTPFVGELGAVVGILLRERLEDWVSGIGLRVGIGAHSQKEDTFDSSADENKDAGA